MNNYWHKKNSDRYYSGEPDIIGLKYGIPVWIEIKEPGDKIKKIQMGVLKDISAHGGYVFIIDSQDDIDKFETWIKDQEILFYFKGRNS